MPNPNRLGLEWVYPNSITGRSSTSHQKKNNKKLCKQLTSSKLVQVKHSLFPIIKNPLLTAEMTYGC